MPQAAPMGRRTHQQQLSQGLLEPIRLEPAFANQQGAKIFFAVALFGERLGELGRRDPVVTQQQIAQAQASGGWRSVFGGLLEPGLRKIAQSRQQGAEAFGGLALQGESLTQLIAAHAAVLKKLFTNSQGGFRNHGLCPLG